MDSFNRIDDERTTGYFLSRYFFFKRALLWYGLYKSKFRVLLMDEIEFFQNFTIKVSNETFFDLT